MATHKVKEFEAHLGKLFADRTHWLRMSVSKAKPGKPPVFHKRKVEKSIELLQMLAVEILKNSVALKELNNKKEHPKKQWHTANKGWGRDAKKQSFDLWFERYINYPNYIYVFWAGKKCKYVGRTVNGNGRPQSHFAKYWFSGVTRIDIYSTSKRSDVPKLECLAIHKFNPSENRNNASLPRWAKTCPICDTTNFIRKEIKYIFNLK